MTASDRREPPKPEAPEQVSCEVCRRQLPAAEALRQEAEDYVLWFCGQECFSKWRSTGERGR
ncbi:MAG: DUF3330 domain-containing protein [Gammaproteobacteria bacterium]|jgi:hypothetical protein